MAKSLAIVGALLIAGGGAAVGFAVTRPATGGLGPEHTAAMSAAVASLDGDIKAARAQVEQRAKTLAETGELRSSIGTDYGTTMDRLGKEIAFKPEANEVLELVQRAKAGGALTTLLLLPDDKMKSPHDGAPGAYVDLMGDQLVVTQVAEVMPSDKVAADTLAGFITVNRKLALGAAVDKLAKAGVDGRLEFGTGDAMKSLAIGAPLAAGAETKTMPLESQPNARLIASVPPRVSGTPVPILAGGAGGAALGLILLVAGLASRRGATSATPPAGANPALTPVPYAPTQMAGTGITAGPGATGTGITASESLANLGIGQQIGRWEILRRLGSGGMADVYLAHAKGEAGFEKQVALKVMHSFLARNERAVQHFLDEARLAARVQHPNVVAIQDLGKIGNDYVIVMDYVDGVDLERLLMNARAHQRQVPLEVALGILRRVCDGLTAAHTAVAADGTPMHIIHRDVKSANVLVSRQGAVKVVDFGIAKATTQVHHTVAGETKGTPSMMAPEQRVGDAVDVRADVYSLAAVGYELVTGQAVNLDLAALAHLGIDNWPHLPAPSSLRPGVPPELDRLLLGAMAFDREKRPANCQAVEDALDDIMKRAGLTASDKDIARWMETERPA